MTARVADLSHGLPGANEDEGGVSLRRALLGFVLALAIPALALAQTVPPVVPGLPNVPQTPGAFIEYDFNRLAEWDHLGLTGVIGHPFLIGDLLIFASDQSRSGATESHHGFDSTGLVRPAQAGSRCGLTEQSVLLTCPD